MECWKGAAGSRAVQAPVAAWAGTRGVLVSVFSGGQPSRDLGSIGQASIVKGTQPKPRGTP